jgi:sodium/bile acid cotransporter 7
MRLKVDWFFLGMLAAVGLAWAWPQVGGKDGPLHPDLLNKLGVALIFFFNGLSLSFASMRSGVLRWPLHLVVQLGTFLLFPLVGLGLLALIGFWLPATLALGFFFLCALPSTVSSSVALTSAARGNVPAALFNATLSSVIGVFLTPLLLGWWNPSSSEGGGVGSATVGRVIGDLVLWLLLPLVLGQLCRSHLGAWALRHRVGLQRVDRMTILFIIYTAFCDSILRGVWTGQGWATVSTALVGGAVLFAVVFGVLQLVCNALRFPIEDRIAVVFCGSKKSIAAGVPMAQVIFSGDPRLGLILLPLLMYHPMQLIICGVLAGRWARR